MTTQPITVYSNPNSITSAKGKYLFEHGATLVTDVQINGDRWRFVYDGDDDDTSGWCDFNDVPITVYAMGDAAGAGEVNDSYKPGDAWFGEGLAEAAVAVVYVFQRFANAKTAVDQADALVGLNDTISDLKTWLPGWDWKSGTMPWEREGDE